MREQAPGDNGVGQMEYLVAQSVAEAVQALQAHRDSRVILGGTDLMVTLRAGHVAPACVVDLSRIRELDGVQAAGGTLRIGAAAKVTDLLRHPGIGRDYPALVDAGSLLGGWQIQNMATVAGNLCNASPAAEMAGPLLVMDAEAESFGPAGKRSIPLHVFWKGPGRTVLEPAEIVTAIVVPAGVDARCSAYQRVHIRHSVDIALVGAAARLEFDGNRIRLARLALGAVAPTPVRVEEVERYLCGRTLSEETLETVAGMARAAARPISDVRASAEYRRAMAGVLARRVMEAAARRRPAP